MFGSNKRYFRSWMKIGAHCLVNGEGSENIFVIKELNMNVGTAMVYDQYGVPDGWEGWENLYRTKKCRCLDKNILTKEDLVQKLHATLMQIDNSTLVQIANTILANKVTVINKNNFKLSK